MHVIRFRQLSIRDKLLAMALLPLLVALPLLAMLLLGWGSTAFDRVLLAKVRSDLAVASGYFDRVLAEVGADTAAVAESHALHIGFTSRSPAGLQPLLQQARDRAGLDFLNLRAADGRLLMTDGDPPASGPRRDATTAVEPPMPPGLPDPGSRVSAAIEVLASDTFATLAPALQWRVGVPIVPASGAGPGEREERAMVALATVPVQGSDGRLIGFVQGGVLLNRNLAFIDHINEIVYPEGSLPFGGHGTSTLFLGDVRISTNVRLFRDERAVGTRVSPAVRDAVLGQGRIWLQRAFVVDDWYISGYQPLRDGSGHRVGMLYVGVLEQPFTRLKMGVLGGITLIFLAVMSVAAIASLRWARSIFQPLEQMTQTMQRVEAGRTDARVGTVAGDMQIGRLAGQLDHLLDVIDDNARSAQQRVVRAEKLAAVGRFTAGIAHELNNPIAVIQGNLDLARELLGTEAVKVGAELKLVDEQIERMRMIMTQLLQFARPAEYAAYVENVDVARVLDDSLRLVGHLLAKTPIEIVRDFAATRAAAINRQELQQVLVNLLANAVDAMPRGGVLMLATRDWGTAGVEIAVTDSGPGLSDELIPNVFDPFVTRKKEGTGLGLWVSKFIVERYGGDIRACNRTDETSGAVFTVQLLTDDPIGLPGE